MYHQIPKRERKFKWYRLCIPIREQYQVEPTNPKLRQANTSNINTIQS